MCKYELKSEMRGYGCVFLSLALETWHFLLEHTMGPPAGCYVTMHLSVLKPWTAKDGLVDELNLMFLSLTFFTFDAIALRLTNHS